MASKHELWLKRLALGLSLVNVNVALFSYLLTKRRVRKTK